MDERAEIWIARDPDTNTESKPVSLRKLRKGLRIGRLTPLMLVKRLDGTAWVTLDRLLTDAATQTPPPPQTQTQTQTPTPTLTPTPTPTLTPPPPPVAKTAAEASGEHDAALTAQWFTEPAPEPDDDEPIFVTQSVLDLNFERVMSTKLVKLAYVLMLAALAVSVLASFIRVAAALAGGNGQQIATAIALVPVVVLACAVIGAFGRMLLEVLLAIFRISDRMARVAR